MKKLEDLQPGDKVTEFYNGNPRYILTIKRLTKTMIITENLAFEDDGKWRKDGYPKKNPNRWFGWGVRIEPFKEEHQIYLDTETERYRVKKTIDTNWKKLNLRQCQEILRVLDLNGDLHG